MIAAKRRPTLASLQTDVLELKREVEQLRAMIRSAAPESDRQVEESGPPGISFEEAAEHVRGSYPHLLRKLSQ